ncbi:MAG TPA: flippase [Candidatus Dormibacteraeota bacterium]|nr:flippase [Candidatus Dormibacteraeota bacterium]
MSVAPASPRRLVRNLSFLGGGQLVTWMLTLVWTLVVPRLIGPAAMGLIVMATAAGGILTGLAGMGSKPMMVKEVAANPRQAPRLLGTALVVRSALIIPCAGLVAGYVHVAGFTGARATALYLAVGLAAFSLLAEVIQAGLQGIERMGFIAANDVINKGLQTILTIPMAVLGFAATWLIGLQVAVAGLVTGLNLVWGRRFRIEWRVDLDDLGAFLIHSLTYWAYAFFFTFYLWLDSTLLSLMAPAQVVGWYGVATRFFQTLMFLPVIISTAWLPRLAAAYQRDPRTLEATARIPIVLAIVLGLPVAAGVVLVSRPLVLLLYGPAYAPSVPALRFLAVTCVPMYLNIVLNQVLTASNRQRAWTRVMLVASACNLAMNLVLIRFFQAREGNGAVGAALSMLGTELVIVVVGIWLLREHFRAGVWWRFARALLATVVMAVAARAAGSRFGLWPEVVVGMASFAVLAVILRLVSSAELSELLGGQPLPWIGRRRGPR